MKKILYFAPIVLAALASCSSDDQPAAADYNGPVNFSASINGSAGSRAFDQTWESGDKIGISCTTGGKVYDNVAYTHAGDGSFTISTSGTEIYYQSPDPVTFTAYYPHSATAANGAAITADSHNQASQKTFDYMWAQAGGKKANPDVAFAFNHKMAKLVLTVKKGLDISYDEVKESVMTLAGFKNTGSFDVVGGVAAATGDACEAWTFSAVSPVTYNNDAETVSYTMILFPQEFEETLPITATTSLQSFATALDFKAANEAIGDEEPKNEWVAGRQYNMSVTLHKTALTVTGCSISAWDEANGGNFDAE